MAAQYITITTRSIFSLILISLAFVTVYLIRDILILLFVSLIIMSALNPLVDAMQERGVSRWLGILLLYLLGFIVIGSLIWSVLPLVVTQIDDFADSAPVLINQVVEGIAILLGNDDVQLHRYLPQFFDAFADEITGTPGFLARTSINIFSFFANAFTLIVFSYYLLLEHKRVKSQIIILFPERHRRKVLRAVERVEFKLGVWSRSQIILMVIVGLMSFVGLALLDINFATSLAIVAGLLEIVPYFGPFVAAIPAIMVGLTQSTWQGIAVLSLYVVIQQLENTVIVPKLMHATVGLDPLIVILAIIIGQRFSGPIGALIAIPVAVVLLIVWSEYREKSEKKT